MSDETLLTLRQLAEQLGLPESTVRYYRDAFLDQIPSVGSGRRRRYPPQAIDVLRSIARSYAAGRSKNEIAANFQHRGPRPASVAVPTPKRGTPRGIADVTNLDLLAAILDGEREQREALWQMAKEIVRLTEVLEGQDKVLNEIAHHAGVTAALEGVSAKPQLGAGKPGAGSEPAPPSPPPPPAPPASAAPAAPAMPSAVVDDTAPAVPRSREAATATWASSPLPGASADGGPPPAPAPAAWSSGHDDMERLRVELEAERALVERLREAKLQLEHRAADAEAELHERRRSSVIRRIFGGDGTT